MNKQGRNRPVLVCGGTGSGKTSSIGKIINEDTGAVTSWGLPPEKTLVLNIELQELVTDNAAEFDDVYVESAKAFMTILDFIIQIEATPAEELRDKLDVEVEGISIKKVLDTEFIVIESLTSYSEKLEQYVSTKFINYEIWTQYTKLLYGVLTKIKLIKKQVFVFGIPETNENDQNFKQYFRIKGKEKKFGGIEKEFQIVLFPKARYDDGGYVTGISFDAKPNKFNTAKAPRGMFLKGMTNDLFYVANAIKKFYNEEPHQDARREAGDLYWTNEQKQ